MYVKLKIELDQKNMHFFVCSLERQGCRGVKEESRPMIASIIYGMNKRKYKYRSKGTVRDEERSVVW